MKQEDAVHALVSREQGQGSVRRTAEPGTKSALPARQTKLLGLLHDVLVVESGTGRG